MKKFVYFIPVIILVVLAFFFYDGLKNNSGKELPSALIDQPAPPFPETILENYQGVDMAELLSQNSHVLVNYFASWCAPCRAEHPHLMKLKEDSVPIVGINYMDKVDNAQKFVKDQGNPYVGIYTDPEGKTAINWGVAGVPETFVIDNNGNVIKRFFGPLTADSIEKELLPILNGN